MNNLSKPDFSGQHIYVGMDVHKKSWSISIMTEHSAHKTFSQPPDPAVLSSYMQRNFPGATYHAAYEAGYSGFWIHDQLHENGIDCRVVNPADVPTKDKERFGKTDKVDCRKLARCLSNGELEGIYVPARVKVEDRGLLLLFCNLRACAGTVNLYRPDSSWVTLSFFLQPVTKCLLTSDCVPTL